jgi:hypothetical protein
MMYLGAGDADILFLPLAVLRHVLERPLKMVQD